MTNGCGRTGLQRYSCIVISKFSILHLFMSKNSASRNSTKIQILNFECGGNRIRTYEVIRQQIYSLSQLATLVFPLKHQNSCSKKQECKIIPFSTFSKLNS